MNSITLVSQSLLQFTIALLPPTFFTLQRHSGLQVVHLHLQAFEGQVTLAGLAFVGNEDDDDEEDEEASGAGDADDGGAAEWTVGGDVDHAWGKLNPPHASLTNRNMQSKTHYCPLAIIS